MVIRILRDDPPKAGSLSFFVTSENEQEALFVETLINLCYDYVELKSGKAVKKDANLHTQKRQDPEGT